jgi:hypothetical protein
MQTADIAMGRALPTYLARNWRRKQAWGGSYLLDKVCHDTSPKPLKILSFSGGERARSDRP